MTLKWQNYQISNFEYLMYLNTLAGRSYNDITQYHIFPWVIKDYSSDFLKLYDVELTFRNLEQPMGCLNPQRLKNFKNVINNGMM